MDAPTNGERPVTQKELIKLQLDLTEKLFEKHAELAQDISEIKESLAASREHQKAEERLEDRSHARRAEVIWTLGTIIAAVALVVSLVH